MHDNLAPQGQRYSLVYSDKTQSGRDSVRARKRIYLLVERVIVEANDALRRRQTYGQPLELSDYQIIKLIESELGVEVSRNATYPLRQFFDRCELQDFLDTITICSIYFENNPHINVAQSFVPEVSRILSELNLSYRVDPSGGVHPIVDQEFEAARVAAISILSESRYAGALKAFENSHAALEMNPSDGKNAIRCIYEAVEIVFKLMFPKADRIGEADLKKHLEPVLQRMRANDPASLGASMRLSNGLANWVNAAHWYRHGQGAEEPVEPPIVLVTTIMGVGASYLRWLVDLDAEIRIMN